MAFVWGGSLTSSRVSFNGEASLVQLQPAGKVCNCSTVVSFKQSPWSLFLLPSNPQGWLKKKKRRNLGSISKNISPVMVWQDCSSSIEVDVPCSVAYQCYSDRESIPKWMTFITSVKVLEDKPDQSRWTLKYHAFGQDLEFSWLARNMQPIPNQKIHWRSLDGLPNSGSVRFIPKGPSACRVDLTISYEVPQILTPVTTALRPFMEMLLSRGLESFAEYARNCFKNASKL